MTKKLEDLFNLDSIDIIQPTFNSINEEILERSENITSTEQQYEEIELITSELPQIRELSQIDEVELDLLASKAEKAYDDLMDLGMNVEVRYSGRIFEVAAGMLKHAIDAKVAKMDKKLKSVDLQLKKYKIDTKPVSNNSAPATINGNNYIELDRNEMLKKLSQK